VPQKVLIIDDDKKLVDLLTGYLAKFEFEASAAGSPELGLKMLRKLQPDLVILDVMLPGKSGFEVVKEIRRESSVPVVMLTARGDVTDRIVGLELGADDYLPKPFEPRELIARMQSVLRRRSEGGGERLVFGSLVIDQTAQRATLGGTDLELSTLEFKALMALAAHPGRVLNRDQIMDRLRGTEWAATDRAIDVLMSRLRQKLGDDPKRPTFVRTVRGAGYVFIAKAGDAGG